MLTKNADSNKYKYTGYHIGPDSRAQFSFTDGSYGKNVIIIEADMSSSVHVDSKGKNVLILGEGPIQGLEDATLTAEAKHPINFKQSGKRVALSLHYNWCNSFLFVNTAVVYQFKAKNSEIKYYSLCLSNVSKDFTNNNMKKTGLKEILILLILRIFYISSNIWWKKHDIK